MEEQYYYIQNRDAGYLGNAIIFWAENSMGYTANIRKAQLFTRAEAERICKGNPDKNKAWHSDIIDNSDGIMLVVDSQYLDVDKIEKF